MQPVPERLHVLLQLGTNGVAVSALGISRYRLSQHTVVLQYGALYCRSRGSEKFLRCERPNDLCVCRSDRQLCPSMLAPCSKPRQHAFSFHWLRWSSTVCAVWVCDDQAHERSVSRYA